MGQFFSTKLRNEMMSKSSLRDHITFYRHKGKHRAFYLVSYLYKKNMRLSVYSKIIDRFPPKLDKKSRFRHIHLCFHYDLPRSKLYAT
jgi:hypothetical protein